MKKLFAFFLFLAFSIHLLIAQTVNYALQNPNGNGYIETTAITELDNSSVATFQMWVKVTEWIVGAKLLTQDNFSIELSANQTIVLKSGSSAAIFQCPLATNEWMQLTLTLDRGLVKAFVNNQEQSVSGELPGQFSVARGKCTLGKGYKGLIDEIRIWKVALEQKDFFWRNTLNKFNPNYEFLISYWKGDQDLCENLVDYKFAHHGTFSGITRVKVDDNRNFRYRVGVGYTNIMRMTDRWRINRDMFLMTNDVILLSARLQSDGSLFTELQNNSAEPVNVDYMAEFEGRKGVMCFKGEGSKMTAANGNIMFDPNASNGHGEPPVASLGFWMFIDSWKEGATLYSQYQNADNCIDVKLGKEEDKSIVVNVNGTYGVLKGKLELNKWQYIGVYIAPREAELGGRFADNIIKVGVNYTVYNKKSGIELSGKDMTIGSVPAFPSVPVVIGKDFAGKLDEIMVWGSNRESNAKADAEKGYLWNVGDWGNIFLNAYWTGDDSGNVGKDYQSMEGVIGRIRDYYSGYRGYKIRVGIVSSQWKNVVNQKEKLDRMLVDATEIIKYCDGLDVDLEWAENQSEYNTYNNVARRLSNEVIAVSPEKKTFTLSLHQYSYRIDKSLLSGVDYLTIQLYGPQTWSYDYNWYVNAYNSFVNYGFPNDKMLLSYSTLAVNGTEMGYISLFDTMGMNDSNFDPDRNVWNSGGSDWYFNGVNQVKRKQNFIVDNDVLGTMYFDMGNDMRVDDYKSLIRAQNEIIASNVDTLITRVDMNPSSVSQIKKSKLSASCYPNPAKGETTLLIDESLFSSNIYCDIYTAGGQIVRQLAISSPTTNLPLDGLAKGVYVLKVCSGEYSETIKLQVD